MKYICESFDREANECKLMRNRVRGGHFMFCKGVYDGYSCYLPSDEEKMHRELQVKQRQEKIKETCFRFVIDWMTEYCFDIVSKEQLDDELSRNKDEKDIDEV